MLTTNLHSKIFIYLFYTLLTVMLINTYHIGHWPTLPTKNTPSKTFSILRKLPTLLAKLSKDKHFGFFNQSLTPGEITEPGTLEIRRAKTKPWRWKIMVNDCRSVTIDLCLLYFKGNFTAKSRWWNARKIRMDAKKIVFFYYGSMFEKLGY